MERTFNSKEVEEMCRGLVKVIQTLQGNFFPEYLVELNGVETIIGQWDIIPL